MVGAALFAACIGTWAAPAAAPETGARSVSVPQIKNAPTLDGRLDEPLWAQAAHLSDFVLFGSGDTPEEPTEAYLATDGKYFYVGVRCTDTSGQNQVCKTERRDGPVCTDDSVELFIAPGCVTGTYFHFMVSAANVQADKLMDEGRRKHIDFPWRSAVFMNPDVFRREFWSVEIAVPMSVFHLRKGRTGGPWRFNLLRNKKTAPREISSWCRLSHSAHEPESFGTLDGMRALDMSDQFAPYVADARAHDLHITGEACEYRVTADIRNAGGKAGDVEIHVKDLPAAGSPSSVSLPLTLRPEEERQLDIRVRAGTMGDRTATLQLRAGREMLSSYEVKGMTSLNPLRAFVGRNIYTTEEQAEILAMITASDVNLDGYTVEASLLQEQVALGKGRAPAAPYGVVATIPLGGVEPGVYTVVTRLLDADGTMVGRDTGILRKYDPAPEGVVEVKLDRVRMCMLFDGKPVCMYGPLSYVPQEIPMIANAGMNMFGEWGSTGGNGTPEKALAMLDAAAEHGLGVSLFTYGYATRGQKRFYKALLSRPAEHRKVFLEGLDHMREVVRATRHHPAIRFYQQEDEASVYDAEGNNISDLYHKFLNMVREEDPYHPVYFGGGAAGGSDRIDYADTLSGWFPWDPATGQSLNVSVKRLRDVFARRFFKIHTPGILYPRLGAAWQKKRYLSPEEQRADLYVRLIHGYRNFLYFCSPFRSRAEYRTLSGLAEELRQLTPILTTSTAGCFYAPDYLVGGPTLLRIRVTPDVLMDQMPILHAVLRPDPSGGVVLLACNASAKPMDVAWDLTALGDDPSVTDVFSKAPLATAQGSLSDTMAGYDYRILSIHGDPVSLPCTNVITAHLSGPAVAAAVGPAQATQPAGRMLVEKGRILDVSHWTIRKPDDAAVDIVADENGDKALRISKASEAPITIRHKESLLCEAGKTYEWGASYKTRLDRTGGAPVVSFFIHSSSDACNQGAPRGPSAGAWTSFSRQLTNSGEEGVEPSLFLRVSPEAQGTILVKELFVREVPAPPEPPKNLLHNTSFEHASVPFLPDLWDIALIVREIGEHGRMIGDPGMPGQSDVDAWHGEHALCLVYPGNRTSLSVRYTPWNATRTGIIINERNVPFTISAYMKADTPGTTVTLQIANFYMNFPQGDESFSKTFTLDTEWKRCAMTFAVPDHWKRYLNQRVCLSLRRSREPGAVLIDAVQLERGPEPTAYSLDGYPVE